MTRPVSVKSIDIIDREVTRITMNIVLTVASENEIEAIEWLLAVISDSDPWAVSYITVNQLRQLLADNSDADGQWNGTDVCDALSQLIASRKEVYGG